MGRTAPPALVDPFEIVIEKARCYVYRKKYPRVTVFTMYVTEYDLLTRAFGGNSFRHGSGYVWVLSERNALYAFLEKMKPYLPSKHGFERRLEKCLP